ncbi:hypothetical protein AVEN_121055-1 [Araneus ventricosus]|uniref:DUF4817 domain-containing protein n=1 Tax=Araneus ventricosus TaxID=182803 RepID=A0A4Y2F6D6_ARAVE|nr:hypothetical protein AVEN_121055-1 [Araneus ventricosus]
MWTSQEKTQCVAWFIDTKSDTQAQRNFRTQYGREPPSRPTLRAWHTSFMEKGNVLHKQWRSTICFRCQRCTWISDFGYEPRLHNQLSLVASTFFVKSVSPGKKKVILSHVNSLLLSSTVLKLLKSKDNLWTPCITKNKKDGNSPTRKVLL